MLLEVSRLGGNGKERRVEEHRERAEREDVNLDAERSRKEIM